MTTPTPPTEKCGKYLGGIQVHGVWCQNLLPCPAHTTDKGWEERFIEAGFTNLLFERKIIDFIRRERELVAKEVIEYALASNNPKELLRNYALYHGIKLETPS